MKLFEIDTVLSPLAREMSHRADEILDLREAALRRENPGRCVSCYFKLLAGEGNRCVTTPLRLWLEQHMEVVACDPAQGELERLPLQLDTEDIMGYCQQVMQDIRHDRSYAGHSAIELTFQFKSLPVASVA